METGSKNESLLMRVSRGAEACLGRGCGWIAVYVAHKPRKTAWLCLMCCLVLSLGWLRIDEEERVEKLYTPQRTRSFRDREWIEDTFEDSDAPDASIVLFNGRKNLASREALRDVFDVYETIVDIGSGQFLGYDERRCAPRISFEDEIVCQKQGILSFWDWNRSVFEADDDILETISNAPKPDCCSPLGFTEIYDVAAKIERNASSSKITAIGVLKMVFYLETSLNSRSRLDPQNLSLEKKFDKKILRLSHSETRLMPLTTFGLRKNMELSYRRDERLVSLVFIFMVFYAFFALYGRREKSRALLGLGAVASVMLSTAAAFGLAIGLGLTFSHLSLVALILVLGIGLDDSFVLSSAVDEAYERHEAWYALSMSPLENDARRVFEFQEIIEEVTARRIIFTLKNSGPSIAVTTMTDAAACFAGAIVRTPYISNFNYFCGISVLVDFAFQITFFVALLTLDQRQKLQRAIRKKKPGADHKSPLSDEPVEYPTNEALAPVERRTVYEDLDDSVFWSTRYPKYLLSLPGKVFVLGVSSAILAMAIVGCLRFEVDIDNDWKFSDVGKFRYAYQSLHFDTDHFPKGTPTYVGVYTKHADYFKAKKDMHNLIDGYGNLGFVVKESLQYNWYYEHEKWLQISAQNVTSSEEWLFSLQEFLKEDLRFRDHIAFDESGSIVGARIDTRWKNEQATETANMRRMRQARKEVRKRAGDLGTVIVHGPFFVWYEAFAFLKHETIKSLVVAVTTVFVVLLVLLGHLAAALSVTALVADVCLCTLGSLYWYNDGLNVSTAFFMVLAAGLSADAPAHICHAFLDSRKPTRRQRASEAIAKLGPSVFRGGLSTIVGIATLGFCVTYIYLRFFRYLMTILVLALWNGLAVMPVLCSLIGPMPTHDTSKTWARGEDKS